MSSPAATTSPSSTTYATSTLHLEQNPSKRPFDPLSTMIVLASLALRPDASRLGYRSGFQFAQHIVREAPKAPILGSFSPTGVEGAGVGSMLKSVAQGVMHGSANMASRARTGTMRMLQGASHDDLSRVKEVFIRYIHNDFKNDVDRELLQWALLGIRKISDAYKGEEGPLQALGVIHKIGTDALIGKVPEEKHTYFGALWTPEEVAAFHQKLKVCYSAMEALKQVESLVKTNVAEEMASLGIKAQNEVENLLANKAQQYERVVSKTLADQAAIWSQTNSSTSALVSPGATTSSSSVTSALREVAEVKGEAKKQTTHQ